MPNDCERNELECPNTHLTETNVFQKNVAKASHDYQYYINKYQEKKQKKTKLILYVKAFKAEESAQQNKN